MSAMRRPTGTVVVTGASTGIGRACALYLASQEGFAVVGTVRGAEDGERLVADSGGRVAAVRMDVTDPASIEAAASEVVGLVGDRGLDGLVNNAGVVVPGPLEFIPLADFRRQLEVNVTGLLATTQAFLPLLRRARGRVVNVSSTSGRLAFPMIGPYAASKFAVEALSDALRLELAPWGLHVAVVQPGPIDTPIWDRAAADSERIEAALPDAARELYADLYTGFARESRRSRRRALPVAAVTRAVAHALTARTPRVRYLVSRRRFLYRVFLPLLPARWRDRLLLRELSR
jgi:NAD(P)-dependent dehydrogenase (short-subunit alcohol dehydrogenase family)